MLGNWFNQIIDTLFPEKSRWVDFSYYSGEKIALLQDIPRAQPLSGRFVEKGLERSVAILSYKHPLAKALIWQIKYKKDAEALRCGGLLLSQKLAEIERDHTNSASTPIFILPIPTTRARRRERGYNQCELLASAMPVNPTLDTHLRFDILTRSKNTSRQATKRREERLYGMRSVFSVSKNALVKFPIPFDTHIIVLDDVVTTGSTLKAALDALQGAGFTNIRGLALAH